MQNFDIIIIGAGPTGLALASYAIKSKKKVLILEKESSIGGCHRVHRIMNENTGDMMFSEHGPRVYSNAFINFMEILKDMGTNFYDLFTEYNFNFTTVGGVSAKTLQIRELLILTAEFLTMSVLPDYGKNISVATFAKRNKFSRNTIEYLDTVCRLTDGATIDTYTLYQFLNLIDQQALYTLYQPKVPNDKGLFKIWKDYLIKNNVTIKTEVDVQLNIVNNKILGVNYSYYADKYVLAIPPVSLVKFLDYNKISDSFGKELKYYSEKTEYIDYISVVYHWDKQITLPKIWGFPKNDWGVGFVVLTDYMKFESGSSKTVISTVITKTNSFSKFTGKTASNSSDYELINELFRQLELDLPKPSSSYIYPLKEEAYVSNTESNYYTIPTRAIDFDNLYSVGTHNKNSEYNFTSMESAVTNAKHFSSMIYKSRKPYSKLITITKILNVVYFITIMFTIYKLI